ncbi:MULTISPECIES: BLUF domain-containing protein [unclassified Frigoribacterium]|uniref:BLUF domain-containing protein n=1 Tax=unclassified Frigoribacterium TaxID=2627005 RepID=UPI0015666FA1|nr:BLUF domain-containing protein [Frigoribacterium sp. VKM Ac-2860]NQX09824.1 BLUF domain-containing protein [Frigoribacterium sp. VKM Ac-2859]
MLSTVYVSRSSYPFTDDDLANLLMTSRSNNARLGITGMLLHREGRFIQVLEGPEEAVRERLAVIARDPRHTAVHTIVDELVEDRLFPAWTMGYRAVTDDLATVLPGYADVFDSGTGNGSGTGSASVAGAGVHDDFSNLSPSSSHKVRTLLRWFRDQPTDVTDGLFSPRAS